MKHYLGSSCCDCGKQHCAHIDEVVIGSGVLGRLPEFIKGYGCKKAFLLADVNTFQAAGAQVCAVLEDGAVGCSKYVFPQSALKPDEQAVGSAVMHFDSSCDIIIGIGSGVINDIGKILSKLSGRRYIIVATAPSMDGYASATSSMDMDGVKVSLPSRCADVIIGDVDILKNAPLHMLRSGIGDMLAKYISIAEWEISHIINGEYYCERIARLIRTAVEKCAGNAEGLLLRDKAAVEAVFEGLVIGGVAMAYAGVSRPASGIEHYFSHIWDMRNLEFGTPNDLHGIMCAMGTVTAAKLYDAIRNTTPDPEKARAYVQAFSYESWAKQLRSFIGTGAEAMITAEQKEQKYSKETHSARFAVIAAHWDEILQIINREIPTCSQLKKLMDKIGIPSDLTAIGVDSRCAAMTFKATADIRDKYILSRLAWDLGILDSLCTLL